MEEEEQKIMELFEKGQQTTNDVRRLLKSSHKRARKILEGMKERKLVYKYIIGNQILWRKYPRVEA